MREIGQTGHAEPLRRDPAGSGPNAMTVDVEDYFHAHALEHWFTRERWPALERRVGGNTRRILDGFERAGIRATFFTLGSVARENPALIREIVARGHELASHGLDHRRVSDQTPGAFLEDVRASKAMLEDISGMEVAGYRAPSFSITPDVWWAFEKLEEAGYRYSSSLSAVHQRAGQKLPSARPFRPGPGALVECPIPTLRLFGLSLPSGGGYFRLAPLARFQRAMRRRAARGEGPVIFYYHPWEIDPGQPKARVGALRNFRHRVNLNRMEGKVGRMIAAFDWAPMKEVFAAALGGGDTARGAT